MSFVIKNDSGVRNGMTDSLPPLQTKQGTYGERLF